MNFNRFIPLYNFKNLKSVTKKNLQKFISKTIENLKNKNHLLNSLNKDYKLNFNFSELKKYKKFKRIIILGMGGSILGAEAIGQFLKHKIKKKIIFLNNLDEDLINEINKSDIILLGVSRTSKTPTSIYLANKGFKTSNIPLVNKNSLPKSLINNPNATCVVGLNTEPERLADLRKNRMNSLKETENKFYTDIENIKKEVEEAKNTFKKYKWPTIDVTRKSVEETAASIIKIYEIYKQNV